MTRTIERQDEELKARSKDWWSNHSQDYVDPGEMDHLGIDADISDEELLVLLDKLDWNFALDGYFAQSRGGDLFSGLLPKSLKGKKVLEVGCGLGAHTEALCRLGGEVTSIDIAPMSVNVTQRRLELKGLSARIMEADAEELPFSDSSFDFIWSWGVIHHSPDTARCAREISRVLRPGGQLAIMLYHRNSLYNWINVVFRYGILQGKLLSMSVQELHNRYTDGKALDGAPLSKYYTAREVRESLFPDFDFKVQTAFEQKHAVSFLAPNAKRRSFEQAIPDALYTKLWSRLGFLLYSEAHKRQ